MSLDVLHGSHSVNVTPISSPEKPALELVSFARVALDLTQSWPTIEMVAAMPSRFALLDSSDSSLHNESQQILVYTQQYYAMPSLDARRWSTDTRVSDIIHLCRECHHMDTNQIYDTDEAFLTWIENICTHQIHDMYDLIPFQKQTADSSSIPPTTILWTLNESSQLAVRQPLLSAIKYSVVSNHIVISLYVTHPTIASLSWSEFRSHILDLCTSTYHMTHKTPGSRPNSMVLLPDMVCVGMLRQTLAEAVESFNVEIKDIVVS